MSEADEFVNHIRQFFHSSEIDELEEDLHKAYDEIETLRAENAELMKLIEEAMNNCETCGGEPVVSRMCARCQTFYKAIIA